MIPAPGSSGLTPLEVALGIPYDEDEVPALRRGRLPRGTDRRAFVRAAMDDVLLPALAGPPCAVAFSGGRDSSVLLALATRAARHAGLPDPVPVTLRFPGVRSSAESGWQEQVVRHLGLADWERVVLADELDLLGPIARQVLRAHGPLWPFNAHLLVPIAERAVGGAVLTGLGGDEVLSGATWHRLHRLLRARTLPRLGDARHLVVGLTPRPLRATVRRHGRGLRAVPPRPWLTAEAQEAFRALWMARAGREPLRWDRWLLTDWWRSRDLRLTVAATSAVVEAAGSRLLHPFTCGEFLPALGAAVGPMGFSDRTAAMHFLAADLLPGDILARTTKAGFSGVFWGPQAREFARTWAGEFADRFPVDVDALQAEWGRPEPDGRTYMLLQHLWHRSECQQPVGHVVQEGPVPRAGQPDHR